MKIRRALISVYDKTGIVEFARALHDEFGIELISTGGTAKVLTEAGIPVTLVETIAGFPELLDGRVKTLHPKIHAAILADRDNPEHMRQLAKQGIEPIDLVVVNLYPFEKAVADPNCTFEQAIEMIDVGGVALLRAAAKNHRHVLVPVHPDDLERLRLWLREDALTNEGWEQVRRDYAVGALLATSRYDAAIASWMSKGRAGAVHLTETEALRYGENPHQCAAAASVAESRVPEVVLRGLTAGVPRSFDLTWAGLLLNRAQALSYNNYLDADAALGLCAELTRAGAMLSRQESDATSGLDAASGLWHRPPAGEPPHGSPTRARHVARRVTEEQWTRRNLPHLQVPGATYFVTFRLIAGQLSPAERDIVLAACTYWHGKRMTLHCATVMPDHVHLLMTPHEARPDEWRSLGEILHSLKSFSGLRVQRARGASGPLWQDESFDRVMRSEKEFIEKWEYIEANPLTAGVVKALPYKWFWSSEAGFGERVASEEGQSAGTMHGSETRATGHRPEAGATAETRDTGHRPEAGATAETRDTGHRPEAGATAETRDTGHRPEAGATAVCFIKHTNACGVGVSGGCSDHDRIEAYRRAYVGDPNAAMGGVLAVNFDVRPEFAEVVLDSLPRWGKAAGAGAFFVEVWIAPSFSDEAVALIRGSKREWGKRVRLLAVGDMGVEPHASELQYRSIAGGMLVQSPDVLGLNEEQWKVVTKRTPGPRELADLRLAWLICKHTKSNAITICKDGMLIGNGAGQMSRVMSCRVAVWLAQENGHLAERGATAPSDHGTMEQGEDGGGAVAASDAFFPFADGPRVLIEAGVTALIQPGGSKRDQETIDLCDSHGVAMIFTGARHFRH